MENSICFSIQNTCHNTPTGIITYHQAGFFSCCSVKLNQLVEYINTNLKMPEIVDGTNNFNWYKTKIGDITYDYFEHYDNINNKIIFICNFYHDQQFDHFSTLDYNIIPIVEKYFTPSSKIKEIISTIEIKYKLDYDNICVLFYRGNDKIKETKLSTYDDYLIYANKIMLQNPNIRFLIQTDETEFIEFVSTHLPNSFYFKDEARHIPKSINTVDRVMYQMNNLFSKYYLAITVIMSKCKYVVCGSGNCSLWIMLYRGHNKNVCQYSKGTWYESLEF
jgi:hypothetical protein